MRSRAPEPNFKARLRDEDYPQFPLVFGYKCILTLHHVPLLTITNMYPMAHRLHHFTQLIIIRSLFLSLPVYMQIPPGVHHFQCTSISACRHTNTRAKAETAHERDPRSKAKVYGHSNSAFKRSRTSSTYKVFG